LQVVILAGGMKALFCLSTIAIISAAYAEADRPIGHIDLRLTKSAETESAPVKNMLASKLSPSPTFVSSKENDVQRASEPTDPGESRATLLFRVDGSVLSPVAAYTYDFPGSYAWADNGPLNRFFNLKGETRLSLVSGVGSGKAGEKPSVGLGIGLRVYCQSKDVDKPSARRATIFVGQWFQGFDLAQNQWMLGFEF
jgi:hypothetical protein